MGRTTTPSEPSLLDLAGDWLGAKRALESASQAEKGNSDRARRGDLERWAILFDGSGAGGPGDGASALARLRPSQLQADALIGAIGEAKGRWSDATVARMLSTLRGFTRWLSRGGHLASDPLDDEFLRASPRRERRPKALSGEDVDRLLAAAGTPPSPRQRLWWPVRDVAPVRFLASTGARAEEACGVRVKDLDRRAERPIWRVDTAKGGRTRDVPLPRHTVIAIDAWLAQRTRGAPDRPPLPARPPRLPPPLRGHAGAAGSPIERDLAVDGPRRPRHHRHLHRRSRYTTHRRPRRRRPPLRSPSPAGRRGPSFVRAPVSVPDTARWPGHLPPHRRTSPGRRQRFGRRVRRPRRASRSPPR
jgi:integrase